MTLVSLLLSSGQLLSRCLLCYRQLLLQPQPLFLHPVELLQSKLLLCLLALQLGPQMPILLVSLFNLPLILSLSSCGWRVQKILEGRV